MAVDSVCNISGNGLEEAKKAYMLPNNLQEINRMKNQHEWIKGSFGGLIKAPIDYEKKHQQILDSATADGEFTSLCRGCFADVFLGIWLCDASTLFPPETRLVGFDIASVSTTIP